MHKCNQCQAYKLCFIRQEFYDKGVKRFTVEIYRPTHVCCIWRRLVRFPSSLGQCVGRSSTDEGAQNCDPVSAC
jgi:hypothetical protein